MAEDKIKKNKQPYWIPVLLFFLTVGAVFLVEQFFLGEEKVIILRNVVMTTLTTGCISFLLIRGLITHSFAYDNESHLLRFLICYLIGAILSMGFYMIPFAGWPYIAIFVGLALFSNTVIGILSGAGLLYISVVLSGADVSIFLLYFVCGTFCVLLFEQLEEGCHIVLLICLSEMLFLIAVTAQVILFTRERLSLELFLIPILNVVISGVILIILLRVFSSLVLYKDRNRYMEINDPEYPLLVELKKFSIEEYYKAVHTAYFCDRISKKLSLDADALKAAGYYHHIGVIKGSNSWDVIQNICEEYRFPQRVSSILEDYLSKKPSFRQKETAILLFSDTVVTSMIFLFQKDKKAILDYDQIIDTIFRKRIENKQLEHCSITMDELSDMKKIFKEEKLYYDFLR